MSTSKYIVILMGILAVVYAIIVSFYSFDAPKTALQNTKALVGGYFSLVDHHGNLMTDQDFKGKYMLIYFGYTYCPDICPTELQIMSDALDQIPEDTLAQISPLFITIDPERDTVEVLSQYAPAFHPNLIGLTGSVEQIKAVKKAFRVYGAKETIEEGADKDSYLMSHTSYTYLMDRNGEYVTHFTTQTDPAIMAKRLIEIIH